MRWSPLERHHAGDHTGRDRGRFGAYVYRAVDEHGQVIDVYISKRRDIADAGTFFTAALAVQDAPSEVVTDRAPALANVIEKLIPGAWHNPGQDENNRMGV